MSENLNTTDEVKTLRERVTTLEAEITTLRGIEHCYWNFFQNASDAIFLMSEDRFLYCNQATEDMFGCARKDIVGSHPFIFSPPKQPDGRDSREKALEKIHAAMNGVPQSFEWVHTRKDRQPFFANVSLNRFHTMDEHRLLAVVRDTTEKKRSEQKLHSYIKELEILYQVAIMGAQSNSVGELLQRTTQMLNDKVYTDSLTIGLINEEDQIVRFYIPSQSDLAYPYRITIPLGMGVAGEVIRSKKSVRVADIRQEPKYIGGNPNIRSELCVPLVANGKVFGVINAESNQIGGFSKNDERFLTTVARQLATEIERERLFCNLQQSNAELNQAYDATLLGWAKALEIRDKETEGHCRRVAELAVKLGRELGFDEEDIIHIYRGSILHDIGKLGIPDRILFKNGSLTREEWEIMQSHPVIARSLFENVTFLQSALDIPYLHHEKWDGSGYPLGLRGKEIPIAARIFSIVDVWDSLLSDRPYRSAMGEDEVRKYIIAQSGIHFDPEIVAIFLQIV